MVAADFHVHLLPYVTPHVSSTVGNASDSDLGESSNKFLLGFESPSRVRFYYVHKPQDLARRPVYDQKPRLSRCELSIRRTGYDLP